MRSMALESQGRSLDRGGGRLKRKRPTSSYGGMTDQKLKMMAPGLDLDAGTSENLLKSIGVSVSKTTRNDQNKQKVTF